MAKRKRRPIALFEVISKSRQYTRAMPEAPAMKASSSPAARLFATPKWWFKRSGPSASAAAEAIVPSEPDAAVAVALKPVTVIEAPQPDASAREAVAVEAAADESPGHADIDYVDDVLTGQPRAQTVHVAVDPERRQIALRMTYTAAIIGSFAVLVIVVLSVIVGQHMSNKGVPLLASSTTSELRAGPAHREVLEPGPRRTVTNLGPQNQPGAQRSTQGGATTEKAATVDTHVQTPPPAAPETTRYIGLNYVIVQSYPESEEKLANETAKFLTGKDIPCTVVKGVKGFMACSVVTLQGFDKQSSPGFKGYVAKIVSYNAEFTGGNRSYKAFTPVGKKWDKQD